MTNSESWLQFMNAAETTKSFDMECESCPAQYATDKETPSKSWNRVTTTLKDIDPSKLHYVKVPENHIVIDFDLKGDDGKNRLKRIWRLLRSGHLRMRSLVKVRQGSIFIIFIMGMYQN